MATLGSEIFKGEDGHIRSERDPGNFGVDARHGAHAPDGIFEIFDIVVVKFARDANGSGDRPCGVGIETRR